MATLPPPTTPPPPHPMGFLDFIASSTVREVKFSFMVERKQYVQNFSLTIVVAVNVEQKRNPRETFLFHNFSKTGRTFENRMCMFQISEHASSASSCWLPPSQPYIEPLFYLDKIFLLFFNIIIIIVLSKKSV